MHAAKKIILIQHCCRLKSRLVEGFVIIHSLITVSSDGMLERVGDLLMYPQQTFTKVVNKLPCCTALHIYRSWQKYINNHIGKVTCNWMLNNSSFRNTVAAEPTIAYKSWNTSSAYKDAKTDHQTRQSCAGDNRCWRSVNVKSQWCYLHCSLIIINA